MAPRPYPAPLASLANSQSHQPPCQYLISAPGGSFSLPRASSPSKPIKGLGPTPFDEGFWGLNGIFRPPTVSMAHGPWDSLGPFWHNYNEAKMGQGERPAAPNASWIPNHK
ncbi:hypothetical protein O181_008994 [Austropuccinia psidii MF-1]|uniref:Uncharacterized protein n=1 Tax=Austropuccinia psidii MF-1 TaxID=1389203 RepID=A0A9Q3BPZ0_9BASI|nr:hypothetical protein [Austropuccinia psidii MF-1]